ncbi:MAG: 3-dehydroquinate dehydratase [Lysobacteraceae bacterium]|nr:MAG: 3-dehydroquinate dehydratase [Xanthomonadaceae bacterium]
MKHQALTATAHKVLILNGPNLDRLGTREPDHYGSESLQVIIERLQTIADQSSVGMDHFQTNAEHRLIERIHAAAEDGTSFIVINPAAWTHTSVALRDALAASAIPFIEIHLSNIHQREPFRRHSYFSDLAVGVVCGLGAQGYELALSAAIRYLEQAK